MNESTTQPTVVEEPKALPPTTPGSGAGVTHHTSSASRPRLDGSVRELTKLRKQLAQLEARRKVMLEQCSALESLKSEPGEDGWRIYAEAKEQAYRDSLVKVSERGKFVAAFFVGIATALIIALGQWTAGAYFQRATRAADLQAQGYSQRVRALEDFGTKFLKSASLAYEMQGEYARIRDELALNEVGGREKALVDQAQWRKNQVARYIEQPSIVTLASVYPATFGDGVLARAEELRAAARAMLDSTTSTAVDSNMDQVQRCYDRVIDAMAAEIKAMR